MVVVVVAAVGWYSINDGTTDKKRHDSKGLHGRLKKHNWKFSSYTASHTDGWMYGRQQSSPSPLCGSEVVRWRWWWWCWQWIYISNSCSWCYCLFRLKPTLGHTPTPLSESASGWKCFVGKSFFFMLWWAFCNKEHGAFDGMLLNICGSWNKETLNDGNITL